MDGDTIIDDLTRAVTSRLVDRAEFGRPPQIPVLTERLSDFEQKIKINLESKLGMCVVVATPEINIGDTPMQLVASVSVIINENVVINQTTSGTRVSASAAAMRAYIALQGWAPPGWSQLSALPNVAPIRIIKGQTDSSPVLSYEVALNTMTILSVEEAPETPLSGTP